MFYQTYSVSYLYKNLPNLFFFLIISVVTEVSIYFFNTDTYTHNDCACVHKYIFNLI